MNRLLPISFVVICLVLFAGSVQAAPPSPGVNIVVNGGFSQSFTNWTRTGNTVWDVNNGVLSIYRTAASGQVNQQLSTYTASTNDPYEASLYIANQTSTNKTLQILVTDGGSLTISCAFTVPANTTFERYRLLGIAPGNMAGIFFVMIPPTGSEPLLVDDIDVRYVPGSQVSSTICTAPATPTPTFTPSPTATATPALAVTWALPTQVINGTPRPVQYAEFSYEFSVGEAAVSILLFALLLIFAGAFVIWLLIGRNRRRV